MHEIAAHLLRLAAAGKVAKLKPATATLLAEALAAYVGLRLPTDVLHVPGEDERPHLAVRRQAQRGGGRRVSKPPRANYRRKLAHCRDVAPSWSDCAMPRTCS
jgi:hypothetical protein